MKNYKWAKLAYEAYCGNRNWKSVRGDPLPQFDAQSQELRDAWYAAAKAVLEEAKNQLSPG